MPSKKSRTISKVKTRSKERWIQQVKFQKGSMRAYVRAKYGSKGFNQDGTLKVTILQEIATDPDVHLKTRRKASSALTLKGISRERKREEELLEIVKEKPETLDQKGIYFHWTGEQSLENIEKEGLHTQPLAEGDTFTAFEILKDKLRDRKLVDEEILEEETDWETSDLIDDYYSIWEESLEERAGIYVSTEMFEWGNPEETTLFGGQKRLLIIDTRDLKVDKKPDSSYLNSYILKQNIPSTHLYLVTFDENWKVKEINRVE